MSELDICLWCADGICTAADDVVTKDGGALCLLFHQESYKLHYSNNHKNVRHKGKKVRAIRNKMVMNWGQGEVKHAV